MCGICGVILHKSVGLAAAELYEALNTLQHRGQDAAGIITCSQKRYYQCKKSGLVRDVFTKESLSTLYGNVGVGHVRYPTAGTSSTAESQPFYVNSPYGVAFAHNGNITNVEDLQSYIEHETDRHINTDSDSELLLNLFAHELQKTTEKKKPEDSDVFDAISAVNRRCRGGYAAVAMITGYGIVAFRDSHGIRPLIVGQRVSESGVDYIVASESAVLDFLGYTIVGDVLPGEGVVFRESSSGTKMIRKVCVDQVYSKTPCIFEYVYFARPDAVIDGISVYRARLNMGAALAKKIQKDQDLLKSIDVVIPVPDTSRVSALETALCLGKKYREGFVKNRYVGRTFIMPGQQLRVKSVRRKLNLLKMEFKDKNVLLVDDSIVRGTTSAEIIKMAREVGAKKVYFASCAPEIRYPNVYGIDMPNKEELVAYDSTCEEISLKIGADKVIFQDLDALKQSCSSLNSDIKDFDCSVFDGCYITGDVNDNYLAGLAAGRSDEAKMKKIDTVDSQDISLHNNA